MSKNTHSHTQYSESRKVMNDKQHKGIFITFEGDDGVGKSTHINFLSEVLKGLGYEVVCLREPGGTSIGEQLRAVVLDPRNPEMSPRCELLIYEAARAQIVSEIIKPALCAGKVVLCDRFSDSTLAYQGYGRGLDTDFIQSANEFATSSLKPDRTLLMVCTQSTDKKKRLNKRSVQDRLDSADSIFHDKVSRGFDTLCQKEPNRIIKIDTKGAHSDTAKQIFNALADLFPELEDGSVDFKETLSNFDERHKH